MAVSIKPLLLWIGALAIAFAPVNASAPIKPPASRVSVISDNLCPTGDDPDAISVCALKMRPQDIVKLHALAQCLANRHVDEARTAVRAYVDRASSDELRTLVTAGADCKPHDPTRISGVLLQGSLAEKLIAARGAGLPAGLDAQKTVNLIDCLVALDPKSATSLISSRPLSHREDQMVTRLASDLPSCVPANTKLQTNALALRAMVALAMFNAIEPRPEGAPLPTAQPLLAASPLITDAKVQRIVAILPAIRVEPRNELPMDMFQSGGHPGLMPYLFPEDIDNASTSFCVAISCLDEKHVQVPVTRDTNSNPYNTNNPPGIGSP